MPRIISYERQVRATGAMEGPNVQAPSRQGEMQLGAAVEKLGNVMADRDQQAEVSDLHAKVAQAQADFTGQLQESLRTADPSDTQVVERLTKSYDDHMEKISEGIQTRGGQNYFNESSAELKSHLTRTAMAGQAELAGVKAKTDYVGSLNSLSSSLQTDPSSFQFAMDQHTRGLDALVKTGGLDTKSAMELKVKGETELAKSAVQGMIDVNPSQAIQDMKDGKWKQYIGGDLEHQLFGEADRAIRAKDIDLERADREQKKALELDQKDTQNKFLEKMVSGSLSTKDILKSNLEAFGSGSKEQFLNLMEKANKEKIQTDPQTFNNLFQRIHADDTDPKKILDENDLNSYVGKGISLDDLNKLRREFQGKGTEAGKLEAQMKKGIFDMAKGQLTRSNPLTGIRDPEGDAQYQKWLVNFSNDFQEGKKAGKSATQLLDPRSPDFVGKSISQFSRSQTQIMKSLTKTVSADPSAPGESPTPPATPRKENESPADFLKRICK